MTSHLRYLHLPFPSSSGIEIFLRRETTRRVHVVACTPAIGRAGQLQRTAPPLDPEGVRANLAPASYTVGAMAAWKPRGRWLSSAAIGNPSLFGDNIIVTKRCAEVTRCVVVRSLNPPSSLTLLVAQRVYFYVKVATFRKLPTVWHVYACNIVERLGASPEPGVISHFGTTEWQLESQC